MTLYEKRTHSVELVRENLTKDASAPLILAVMVNGTGYAEKIERRLRDRVAVENALARAGYSPNDPEHLGSFTIPWSRYPENLSNIKSPPPAPTSSATPKTMWEGNIDSTHLALTAGPKASSSAEAPNRESGGSSWRRGGDDKALMDSEDHTQLIVPFELHKPDPVGMTRPLCDNVLVLWLRQNFFDDAPLARLAQLFSWFQKSDGTLCAKVKILGPDTSDDVRKRHQRNGIADFMGEYLDVILIARRTRAVTKLIYYPFIAISLLVICRLPEFDNFDWPTILIVIFSFNGLLACGCVLILRGLAETVRRESLKHLREHLMQSRSNDDRPRCEAIEGVIQEIQELDEGIFAPITRQPVVGAVLLPSASAGVWALLQYFH